MVFIATQIFANLNWDNWSDIALCLPFMYFNFARTIKTIDQILHYACPLCISTLFACNQDNWSDIALCLPKMYLNLFACNQDSWSGITKHLPIMYLNFVAIRTTDQIFVLCLPIMYLNFAFYQILHYAWYVCIWTAFHNQGNWSDIRLFMSKS